MVKVRYSHRAPFFIQGVTMDEMKLGARNSAKDKERIAAIKDAANSII